MNTMKRLQRRLIKLQNASKVTKKGWQSNWRKNLPGASKYLNSGLPIARHLATRKLERLISVQKLGPFKCMHRFSTKVDTAGCDAKDTSNQLGEGSLSFFARFSFFALAERQASNDNMCALRTSRKRGMADLEKKQSKPWSGDVNS